MISTGIALVGGQCKSYLLHRIEDVRLSVTVPIRANTKVDFPRVFVGLESLGDTYE